MTFRTLGKIELLCAVALFLVQEWILALIFAGLGVFMLFGIKEQPKKQPAPARKAPAAKNPAPVQKQNSLAQNQTTPSGAPAADAYAFRGSVDKYFLTLLQNAFPGYQVEQNVSLSSLNNGASASAAWTCSCGEHNTGKFCADCGKPRPAAKTVVNAPKNSEPLTFLLRQNGTPKMGIILCGKYAWDTVQIHNTMEACKKAKIPCLRFMREFRNDADYVTNRIRKVLR